MHDWNGNGKIDAHDHAFSAYITSGQDQNTGGAGCCGPTLVMLLLPILLPVVLTVVFRAH